MDRRDILKHMLLGGTSAGVLLSTGLACHPQATGEDGLEAPSDQGYGIRTEAEERWDRRVRAETFFTAGELSAMLTLADAICPEDESGPAASATGIADFFEFNVKDRPDIQLPMRGGLAFVQQYARNTFGGKTITELEPDQLDQLLKLLSYPEKAEEMPELEPAIAYISALRYITLTGYYTSPEGVKALGYAGNIPNQWDGVPPQVLAQYEVDYDPEWIARCVDQDTAHETAQWDDDMNLVN